MKAEIAEHTQLEWSVRIPVWVTFGYGDGIQEMDHDFHCQKSKNKSNGIGDGPFAGYTR